MRIDINLDDVKNPFEPVVEGRYFLNCKTSSDEPTKKGEAMITLEMEIIGSKNEEDNGKQVMEYLVIGDGTQRYHKGARWRWAEYCRAIGSDGKDSTDVQGQRFDVELGVKPGNEEYPNPSNFVKKVYGRA